MNLHNAVKSVLLPACLETTARMAEKIAASALDTASPLAERVKWADARLRKAGWADAAHRIGFVEAALMIAHGRDAVKNIRVESLLNSQAEEITLDPLTVIKAVDVKTGHSLRPLNEGFIVTSGKNRRLLWENGTEWGHYSFPSHGGGDFSVCTDLEIETAIDKLTIEQVRFILANNDVFAPVLASLYKPQEGAVVEPPPT